MKILNSSTTRGSVHLIMTAFLLLASALLSLALFSPVQAQSQGASPNAPATTDASAMPMMGAMTGTMSMAEMGAKMDAMMAHMTEMMASMPMSGTTMMGEGMMDEGMMGGMSMQEMGQMMQMMGMMHQKMGQMQMMMGAMMSGDMMGAKMMGEGMMGSEGMGGMMGNATPQPESASPSATATVTPTATVDHSAHQAGDQAQDAAKDAAEGETGDDAKDAAEEQAEGEAVDNAEHPAPALVAAPQSAASGAVTIEATPLTTDNVLDVAFSVTLETHSVALDFDLAERATLTIGEATFPATSWEPDAASGHHVSGILRFTIDHPAHSALNDVEHISVELKDIDGTEATLNFPLDK